MRTMKQETYFVIIDIAGVESLVAVTQAFWLTSHYYVFEIFATRKRKPENRATEWNSLGTDSNEKINELENMRTKMTVIFDLWNHASNYAIQATTRYLLCRPPLSWSLFGNIRSRNFDDYNAKRDVYQFSKLFHQLRSHYELHAQTLYIKWIIWCPNWRYTNKFSFE